ncbi:Hok/Gef family protein [Cronobacter muytjensii]|uniref:Hok/Gef family protein n=1 Tax=Cronobacter TaxID=413496 RepID=UPI000576B8E4|nr:MULTISPECIES: Hok/Gef family protein [Cronobacter]ELZ8931585.1 type I toxin-antitoxin system Hok family toxin [Cronobacter dublinensis]ALB69247.1 Hok/gef cell toxic protein [Cronobacter muytjensii ATCC 51329]EGT4338291.1 type I toxin-antitoxin system hok family toxin [Cronobacter muytjensii]EKS1843602.1 type I toxin-antitoxin system Hok family toxin [Cronobacter muytjensii]ELY2495739.1 type I toxin-antitoxin system Hok family toxin [Cronobacter muytjensii]
MMPLRYLLACLLVVCVTILIFALMNRGMLCEFTIRSGNQEVAAKLSCKDK